MVTRREFLEQGAVLCAAALIPGTAMAEGDRMVVKLPVPDRDTGKPLMTCLADRQTDRSFTHEEVDLPVLGGLLWAAFGVNRRDGRHVIPTAMNRQQVGVYAVRGDGVWQYIPKKNAIMRVINGDRRAAFDGAGLILLYTAPQNDRFSGMHVGSMYQNVCLYCASNDLVNCVKYQKHDVLDKELPLEKGWMTYITHSISARPAS